MAKVRLQIELDEKAHKLICGDGVTLFNTGMRCGKTLLSQILVAIRNGTPALTCGDCIEHNKEFFKKWVNCKMLDKISAEIKRISDEEQKHDEKWAIGLRYAVKIIDKYKTDMLK